MKAVVWSFCVAALGAGLVAGIAAVFLPLDLGVVVDIYLLFLGGITLLALVRSLRVAQPGSGHSPFELALRPIRPRLERPPELVLLEQRLALAVTTAFDVHFRLRPAVRDVAAQRLWAKHGVDLETQPDRARGLLGADVWELARPDRPPPADPFAAGLGERGIERVVAELERV
jgi:hypothetical protein